MPSARSWALPVAWWSKSRIKIIQTSPPCEGFFIPVQIQYTTANTPDRCDMPAKYPGNAATKPARAKSGGGYESAIEVVPAPVGALSLAKLDGDTSNGSRVRISTDGTYSIGAKPGGAHELHDFGDKAYERGVENTFNASIADDSSFPNAEDNRVWTQILTTQSGVAAPALKSDSSLQRHENASRFYRLYGNKARMDEPKAFEEMGRTAGHRVLYHAYWMRVKYNAAFWRDLTGADQVGSFIPDEPLSVNDGEFSGVYISFNSGEARPHRVVIENAARNNTNLNGKVVTGLTSGASMTFQGAALPGQYKIGRYWDNPTVGEGGMRCSLALTDGYLKISDVHQYQSMDLVPGQWYLVEHEIDLTNKYWRHSHGGVVRFEQSGFADLGDPNFSIAISQVGTDGLDFPEQVTDYAEHVFDRTLYRVYLANAPEWSSVTHREVQRLISWDGSVDVAINYGALAGGWLYLIGADGQPINTTGLELS